MLFCISLIHWTVSGFPNPQQFHLTEAKEAFGWGTENPLVAHPKAVFGSSYVLPLYKVRRRSLDTGLVMG